MANAVTGPTPGGVINRTASSLLLPLAGSSRRCPLPVPPALLATAGAAVPRTAAGATSPTRPPHLRPQLVLFLHPVAQRHGLQLVLGACPRLHLLVPMHQQLPHIPLLQTRHPDFRKPILTQQIEQMFRVPPVRLLPAHHPARIFAASPSFNSNPNSPSRRSN